MNVDALKAELIKYRAVIDDINALIAQRNELREIASCIGSSLEGGEHGSDISRKTEKLALKIAGIDEEIETEIQQLHEHETRIKALINRLPESIERSVLLYRYIDGYTYERISNAIRKQPRWTIELHERALRKLSKLTD